jgi:hypothetical protein
MSEESDILFDKKQPACRNVSLINYSKPDLGWNACMPWLRMNTPLHKLPGWNALLVVATGHGVTEIPSSRIPLHVTIRVIN